MKEEDIDVSIVGDTLTIKSEKKSEKEVKGQDYYRSDRMSVETRAQLLN